MSFYGYKRDTTPSINSFFKNSYVFNNAFAPATLTYTDAISLFYSLSPHIHKAFVRQKKQATIEILKNYKSLASILAENGYTTAAFVSDEDYEYEWGLGKTFQLYFDRSHYSDYGIKFKPFTYSVGTKQLVPVANKWLEENKNKKKFMFLQAYDLHCPFSPEDNFNKLYPLPHNESLPLTTECLMAKDKMEPIKKDGKIKFKMNSFFAYLEKNEKTYYLEKKDIDYLISKYDAEINQADFYLSKLFSQIQKLGLDKNSIIVLLTEHGDYQGENGYFFKTSATPEANLHNNNLNIPLLIKTPDSKSKVKQNQLIQMIDIAPTFLDLLGISPDKKMQGKSFKNILNSSTEINDYTYASSVRFGFVKLMPNGNYYYRLESLQNHEWKLDHSIQFSFPDRTFVKEEFFLFNMTKDPDEKHNLINTVTYKKQIESLKKILEQKRDQYSTQDSK